MDRKLSKKQEIQRLIRLSENARATLGHEAHALQQRLDFPARIRSSLKKNPTSWLLGSAATGLATTLLFRRKTKVVAEKTSRSIPRTLLGLTLKTARPLAKVWLTNQVKNYLTRPQPPTPATTRR